jgi:hypothetical protein
MADKEFSLAERLDHGNLTIDEVRELKNRSHSGFYEDLNSRIAATPGSTRTSRRAS